MADRRSRTEIVRPARRHVLLWSLVALGVGAAFVLNSPWFSVSEIEVVGEVRSEVTARIAETGIGEGALLLWVDTGAIERAVAADPWVLDVKVERVWPDRVVVEVLERTPVVWIEGVLGWMLVSRDGAVVQTAEHPGEDLMQAALALPDRPVGDRPGDAVWEEVVAMARTMEGLGTTLRLEMRGSEMWTSAAGVAVRLGHPVELVAKGRVLMAMLGEDLPSGSIIDLTSPLRPAVVPPEVEGS